MSLSGIEGGPPRLPVDGPDFDTETDSEDLPPVAEFERAFVFNVDPVSDIGEVEETVGTGEETGDFDVEAGLDFSGGEFDSST